MPARNIDFYNGNEALPYPLSDEASGIDDSGIRLPPQILTDIKLMMPDAAGRRAMLNTVTITQSLVSVVISGCPDVGDPDSVVPVAAASIAKPVQPYKVYPLSPLYPGAGGWIVFGRTAAETVSDCLTYSGRFTNPTQSLLLPSTVCPYAAPPVTDVGVYGNKDPLTGLVRLKGGKDIEIVAEAREVPGFPLVDGESPADADIPDSRQVIVIRLKPAEGTAPENVFDLYRGPCGGRPEAGTCPDPQPIELLGGVLPDCCGNITLQLDGCAEPYEIEEEKELSLAEYINAQPTCGVIVNCNLDISAACVSPNRLPNDEGILPGEYDDLCGSLSEISESLPGDSLLPTFAIDLSDEEANQDPTLPYCSGLEDAAPVGPRDDLTFLIGHFEYVDISGDSHVSSENPLYASMQHIALFTLEEELRYRRISTSIRMSSSSSFQRHNAGIIFGPHIGAAAPLASYCIVEADWDSALYGIKSLRILRTSGTSFSVVDYQEVSQLSLDTTYILSVTFYPVIGNSSAMWLVPEIHSIPGDPNPVNVEMSPVFLSNFTDFTSNYGLHALMSGSRFGYVCLQNSLDPESSL